MIFVWNIYVRTRLIWESVNIEYTCIHSSCNFLACSKTLLLIESNVLLCIASVSYVCSSLCYDPLQSENPDYVRSIRWRATFLWNCATSSFGWCTSTTKNLNVQEAQLQNSSTYITRFQRFNVSSDAALLHSRIALWTSTTKAFILLQRGQRGTIPNPPFKRCSPFHKFGVRVCIEVEIS